MTTDDLDACVHTSQELFAQAYTPSFEPGVGLKNIPFDLRCEVQFNGHIDCELGSESLPRKVLSLGYEGDSVFGALVLPFANRIPVPLRAMTRCHPRGLFVAEVFN
jgi:hypothetical protein